MDGNMKTVLKEIKYWCQLFLLPIYGLSFLIPRSKKIWVFGSTFGKRFADNPKYFFLYLNQNHSEHVRAIWITKNKEIACYLTSNKMEAYYLYSMKGIWYCLRAMVYIYDNYSKDICYTLSGGAKKINLWHGIPLKKIQKDNRNDKVRNPSTLTEKLHGIPRRISDEKPSHFVATTSDMLVPIFKSAFQTKNVINCGGYPRNDVLLLQDLENLLSEQELSSLEKIRRKKAAIGNALTKMVLYMPTFRDSESLFLQLLDIEKLNKVLTEKNILFCIKLHPKSKLKNDILKLSSEHIVILDPDDDPYVFLNMADILITDYSSIYFDYLLTDKPILFFCYDLEDYLSNSREMYFDYEEYTPGMKIRTMEELVQALSKIDELSKIDPNREKRTQIRCNVFDYIKGSASERLFRYIQDRIIKL